MGLSLIYVGQQVTIYAGFFFLFTGVFGNCMNMLIFSSERRYRKTPCTFYFLIESIFNNLYVIINMTSRISGIGYGVDSGNTSVIWCKVRQFLIVTFAVVSLYCSCLASIDQFLVTSRDIRLR